MREKNRRTAAKSRPLRVPRRAEYLRKVRVLFVVPPMFDGGGARARPEIFTPLGLLSLAAVAERHGHTAEVLDFNLLVADGVLEWDSAALGRAVDAIVDRRADVVGFTTMATTYPVTLRLVRALRRRDGAVRILLGGSQASTVDRETLTAFPEVTGILRGEAETTLPDALGWCAGESEPERVRGLTYHRNGEISRTPDPPLIADLDTIPEPAWHLYPIERVVPLPIDAGRGCPFECTFCTTNIFFRRKFRMKSPERLVAECRNLMARTGQRRFFFVHDLFTVNRRMVVDVCNALIRADLGIEWRSSARVDLVDDELLALLARSGCKNLFFGIESGSEESQRAIKKRIKVRDVVPKLETALRLGIEPTASFIIGFPDETLADLRATAEMALGLVRAGVGDVYIHNLMPLPGAAVTERHRSELVFTPRTAWFSGTESADAALVRRHPELFSSFHVFPRRGPWLARQLMMHGADLVRSVHARRGRSFVRSGPEPAGALAPTSEHRASVAAE